MDFHVSDILVTVFFFLNVFALLFLFCCKALRSHFFEKCSINKVISGKQNFLKGVKSKAQHKRFLTKNPYFQFTKVQLLQCAKSFIQVPKIQHRLCRIYYWSTTTNNATDQVSIKRQLELQSSLNIHKITAAFSSSSGKGTNLKS